MDDVINLINHLINAKYSIDALESISNQLNISQEQIHRILRADRYKDYFQLIRKNPNQGTDKIALTLDLFCCTHYAQLCKKQSCPFLHLCPYNIRPMHGKCTNKNCPYDHEVLKSAHNKKLINTRGLSFLSDSILLELARASADPNRSFWVCTDNGKKGGCQKKTCCDKLHYCYFSLINACTKTYCPHIINEACIAYFRHKDLSEQDQHDILEAFQKVLKQRKPDFINTVNIPPHPSWALSISSDEKSLPLNDNISESTIIDQQPAGLSSIRSILSATAPEYKAKTVYKSDISPPLPEHEQDILLIDTSDESECSEIELHLTQEIGYSIRLSISKTIICGYKNAQYFDNQIEPVYYYCPTENLKDTWRLLRCQNDQNQLIKPLIIYSNIRDAHEATELNIETNQFCLLRLLVFQSNLIQENCLEIYDPTTICFDRMWIYVYSDEGTF
ncbi:unnamed protein product [Adineta steineri]|uniref:Uncharacterized protein n=1 Tax=Adineta steineri TaxID=433720 RepID=A0A814VML5_9BILA|nr:unnamed protein product [Adineta steineri]CAF1190097.1 unnamed protein product [Adineta steineri]